MEHKLTVSVHLERPIHQEVWNSQRLNELADYLIGQGLIQKEGLDVDGASAHVRVHLTEEGIKTLEKYLK
ncbi:hypothetical protein ABB02_00558 [Clostridiaceae bacterium JG1575]|nr:hypothetical protein ABB02_00558 [Clostridiaceae bacterium JG1575]